MRLYRGLKEPYRADKVGSRQQGARPGMFGTDFTDCPFAALRYAQGRRGELLVLEVPDGEARLSQEQWGFRQDGPKRLMLWGHFDEFIVARIPAKELRIHVRQQGVAAADDAYKAVVLERAVRDWLKARRAS